MASGATQKVFSLLNKLQSRHDASEICLFLSDDQRPLVVDCLLAEH